MGYGMAFGIVVEPQATDPNARAKLFLLGAGALVAAYTQLFHLESFLFSFLAAMALGEGMGLTALARAPQNPKPQTTREDTR